MKQTLFLPAVMTALLIAGCSSTPTSVDHGSVKARTFSFINNGKAPAADFADGREAVHKIIQAAITDNLAGKGVTKVASGGDVTVAYLIIIGNNGTTELVNTYFGYGRDASGLHDKAQEAYTSSKNPNYFEAGTLLIDIVDSKTFKVLKRSYVTRPILRNTTAAVTTERLQEAVKSALGDLRIAL